MTTDVRYSALALPEIDTEQATGAKEIPLGADVYCIDTEDPIGRARYVVLDPVAERLTRVVVCDRRRPEIGRVVPLGQVGEVAPKRIWLTCTKDEFRGLRPFIAKEYLRAKNPFADYDPGEVLVLPYVLLHIEPGSEEQTYRSIPLLELQVRRGIRIEAADGPIGTVGELVIHPIDGNITHLMLGKDHPWGERDVAIPVTDIERIRENVVYLRLNKLLIRGLPHVRVQRKWT